VAVDLETADPERLERALRAGYAAGLDELTVSAPDPFGDEARRVLSRVTRNLTGLTVAAEAERTATVRTMLDPGEVSVRQSVRHLSFTALSMHRDAVDALLSEDAGGVQLDRDDQADRLFAMVDRQFSCGLARLETLEALGFDRTALFECWLAARELERVADHAERIGAVARDLDADARADLDESVAATLDDLAARSREVVETAVGGLLADEGGGPTERIAGAQDALDARDALRTDAEALDRRLFESATAPYRLTHAVEHVRRTAEHGGNVAEVAMRRALREGADRAVPDAEADAVDAESVTGASADGEP
jgi:phosphate uptake regulator